MDKLRRDLPPLDLLRGFESAARHLSFTRAAAELFLTQSAVSRQIQALEQHVGTPLFERRHRALALTPHGHAYYRSVAAALDDVRAATRRLREARSGEVLTVTTTISFGSLWLVPRLGGWRKSHPGVDVRLTASHEVADLDREGIDVAIRDCALERVPAGAVHLASDHMAPMCSPGYAKESRAEGRPLRRPADLRHHVLVTLHDPTGRWPWLSWAAWLEAMGVPRLQPAGTLAFDQYDQAMNAALHGQGVALGRMTLADEHLRGRRLVTLFGPPTAVGRGYHAIFSSRARDSAQARAFVEWVRREIRREEG